MFLLDFIYAYPWVTTLMGILQIAAVIHVLVRRKDLWWIFVLIFLPLVGIILYFFLEIFPYLRRGRLAVDLEPLRDKFQSSETRIKHRQAQLDESNTLKNRLALVQEYKAQKRFDEAEQSLEPALDGVFRDDPYVGYELAELYFLQADYQASIAKAEGILKTAPFDLKPRLYLLLAESYAKTGQIAKAAENFEKAIPQSFNEEARVKYSRFLLEQHQTAKAQSLIQEIKRSYQQASTLYKREQKVWMAELAELEKVVAERAK